MKFSAIIRITGVNPYILVSKPRAHALLPGWRRPLPVRVRINGEPQRAWRINMMPRGDGSFYLYLQTTVRKASRTKVGDRVSVELEFDDEYTSGPTHPMPERFLELLSQNARARTAWDALIPSRQKEVVRYVAGLKSEEARERNILKAVEALGGETVRFMGRTWISGR